MGNRNTWREAGKGDPETEGAISPVLEGSEWASVPLEAAIKMAT